MISRGADAIAAIARPPLLVLRFRASGALGLGDAALGLQASLDGPGMGPRRDPRFALRGPALQLLPYPLERERAVAALGARLGRDPRDPGRAMADAHAGLGLVLLLPARARRLERHDVALVQQALEMGRERHDQEPQRSGDRAASQFPRAPAAAPGGRGTKRMRKI